MVVAEGGLCSIYFLCLALPQTDSQVMSESTSVGETERKGLSHHSVEELYFY